MKKTILFFSLLLTANLLFAQDWEAVAPLPGGSSDARHHPVTFSIDGFGYLLTGSVNGIAEDDFMRYDPNTDTWETLPDFPGPARSFSYATSRGSKAYLGFGGANGVPFNDLWEFDSETQEWTELSSCPCEGRYHPAFIQLDDKIYMGMGNNTANLRDWWEYDIPTDTWTEKDDLPGATRHHPFYFGVDGIAYVGLGHGNNVGGALDIYSDWYKFDPATDEWTQLDDFPGEARVAGTQFDYNGKGYILSGDGDNHFFMESGEFWEYDTELDTWTPLPPHPGNSSRWAPGNFVIDNYVYFMCGESIDGLEHDMMRFELEPLSTSTEEILADDFTIYPNPARNSITIADNLTDFSEVLLLNSFGQVVRPMIANRVDVSDLPNGMYFLQFFKGEETITKKVLVQH